jgi:hypothetical protein
LLHKFLAERETLVGLKSLNPALRLSDISTLANLTAVRVQKTKTTGLKKPEVTFIELSVYEDKYGVVPADQKHKIIMEEIDGKMIAGARALVP